jgi:hypothetical protein
MDIGTATGVTVTMVGAGATITVGDNQARIARISDEISIVAKLEKVSDTA